MIDFISTRNIKQKVTSKEAIIKGLSVDGGLYTPTSLPTMNINDLQKILEYNYIELANEILYKILNDYTFEELSFCTKNAYSNTFDTNDITPLSKIGNDYLLELYHGPTSAFKDIALSILPNLLSVAYKSLDINKKIMILVATSGDTGSSALNGFKNVPNTFVNVFYPKDGTSIIQEKQMTIASGENVNVTSINGNFDDCQKIVKYIFENNNIKNICNEKNITFSSANSINIGRLLPQIVYYFKAYFNLCKNNEIKIGEEINFFVPSGNFGNILAGFFAKKIGLPINKLICASNENNVLTDFFRTGIYDKNRKLYNTLSPSMDILVSSNLERLLFLLSDYDDKKVSSYMNDLKNKGIYKIDTNLKNNIQDVFLSFNANDTMCKLKIREIYEEYGIILDPHTAVAVCANEQFKKERINNNKNVILSTASFYKFPRAILSSLNKKISNDDFINMENLQSLTKIKIPQNLSSLFNKKAIFNDVINNDESIATTYIKELICKKF
ncbi:MAG: threonine synthase [Eubacteriales bacterium]|nr:threonine synthase [Eubacteriales bacterium]